MKRVVVGLSGGVDSSVSAYLLKEAGYDVIGIFMKNWHDESVTLSDDCPWIDDSNDALLIANQLGIPFQVLDLSKEYRERIVNYMFAEYAAGRTPNPDVLCNREIKFDVFLNAAMQLGADYVATGHYCRTHLAENGETQLLSGADRSKDQSYFLCQLTQAQLQKVLFPIGHLQKTEVRNIAAKQGLITAGKKDSQGLCFVGKISLPVFLQQQLNVKKGHIIEIPSNHPKVLRYHNLAVNLENVEQLSEKIHFEAEDGLCVGEHDGAHFYTIGQRKGLQIGGRPFPSFVIGLDTESNLVYTGQKDEHGGLNKWALEIENQSIIVNSSMLEIKENHPVELNFRIRYRQPLQSGQLIRKNNRTFVLFSELQRGITPGQFCAFYLGDQLLGSGVIR